MGRNISMYGPPGGNRDERARTQTIIQAQQTTSGNNNNSNNNSNNKRSHEQQSTNNNKRQTKLSQFTTIKQAAPIVNPITLNDDATTEYWGDPMTSKADNVFRICFENINSLGFDVLHNTKQDRFITWAKENSIDSIGWTEININWRLTTPSEKLRERMRPGCWDKLAITTAHNIHEKLTKYQPGGVGLLTFDQLAHRVSSSGSDPSGLGRWAWQCIKCKTRNVRIVSAYQPNITVGEEKQTVYAQHQRYLKYIIKSPLCPREAFRLDLATELRQWMEKGDQIILLMDANDDLRDGVTHNWLTGTVGLRNCLHEKHAHLSPPSTYFRNFRHKPIDGCYISPNMIIEKGGFLPFGEGIGDHRILYIDIDINSWLEGDLQKIVPSQIRRLKCEDVRIVRKFLQELRKRLDDRGLRDRVNALYENYHVPLTPTQIQEYESIDRFVTECSLTAEKRCRKIRVGGVPFSPVVDKAAKTVYLWSLILSKMSGTKVSTSLIKRLAKKCDLIIDLSLSYEEIRILRNAAIKRYKSLKPNAKKYREQFISDLAEVMEEVYGAKRASSIRSLTVTEEQRTINRQIKSKLKPNSGSISKLQIPDPANPGAFKWTEDKDEIETNIIAANEKKFRLADATPFRQEPLLSQCGPYATSEDSNNILLGTYDTSNLDDGTSLFIKKLKVADEILERPPIPSKITTQDFQDYWRKVREKTSSSPSGRHFGQWKAIARSNDLSDTFAKLTSLPAETGYSPNRWKKRLECSLEKKGKRLRPDELRTIVLLEGDYNQCLKLIFGKRMMRNSEFAPDYPASQFGSKRGSRSIEAVRLKRMSLDMIRLYRKPATIITTDLHSCYDRIVHSVGALSARRNGVQPEPIRMVVDTLQHSENTIRTGFGDSDRAHYSTPERPYHGTGQGSGASPAIWFAITIVLIEALMQEQIGTFLTLAMSLQLIRFPAILFVDDTDFVVTGQSENEDAVSVRLQSQRTLLLWSALLHATGGSLRPEKCRWSLIDFRWKAGKPVYQSTQDAPGSLMAYNSDRRMEIVRRIEPHQDVEILGVLMNAIGTDKGEFERTTKDVESWNERIMQGSMYKQAATTALKSTIYRTVCYRLPATQFSKPQCDHITFKLHCNILSKMGINKRLPNPYRYAPPSHNGLGLMNVRLEQFISHAMELVLHSSRNTLNGLVTLGELEICHLHVGTAECLWNIPFDNYHFLLPECEIKYVMQESDHFQVRIIGDYTRPQPQRVHDFFLMDRLFHSPFTTQEIELINSCRIYLQVLTLTDISLGNGRSVDQDMYHGRISQHRKSTFQWPRQPRPSRLAWDKWQEAIDTIWTNHQIIEPPLGSWLTKPIQKWYWYHDVATNTLFKINDDTTITQYPALDHIQRRHRNYFSEFGTPSQQVPVTACPVIPHRANHALCCTSGTTPPQPVPTSTDSRFHDTLSTLDDITQQWMEYSFIQDATLQTAIDLISNKQAIIVVDGSYLPGSNIATAAWIFAGPDGPIEGLGYCRLPDGDHDNDPYRAEIFGLCLAVTFLKVIFIARPELTGSITISCDNDEALKQGIMYQMWPKSQSPHFDLLATLHSLRSQISISYMAKQVRGHQDRFTNAPLTRLEELNVLADEAARTMAYRVERSREVQRNLKSPQHIWKLAIDDVILKKDVRRIIQEFVLGQSLKNHWIAKGKFTIDSIDGIDWEALRHAVKRKPLHHQRWATKFISGFSGSNHKLHQMGKHSTGLCPRCELFAENTTHILFCQNSKSKESRRDALVSLDRWLETSQTRWDIRETIVHTLTDLQSTSKLASHVPFNPYDESIHTAARHQDTIGLQNMLEGFISVEWRKIMSHYYRDIQSNRTVQSWAAGLHTQLQLFSRAQWEHRNSVVHARNTKGRKIINEQKLQSRLEYQLNLGIRYLPVHLHHLVSYTVNEALKQPRSKMMSWLHHLETVRPYYEEAESREVNTQRIFIRHWLRT